MRIRSFGAALLLIIAFSGRLLASQADDTTITITGHNPGTTPFISQLTLSASDTSVIKSITFTITPKTGSVTRPLSGTYSNAYLVGRGDIVPASGMIFLPVYGLYAAYTNTVTLTYNFLDGSTKTDSTTITTDSFADPCRYNSPAVLQPRTDSTALSYDYMFLKGFCANSAPAIVDTDGNQRWTAAIAADGAYPDGFFDNAVYFASEKSIYRVELDGTVTMLHDYTNDNLNLVAFHHNMDRGKTGILVEIDTIAYLESVFLEIDYAGNILKIWNMADIISAAMTAGGDDPSQFVYYYPNDWFHSNSAFYNRADDSLIISAREDFVICIDYESGTIKWILGDPTKKWHQFPSLAAFAINLAPGSLAPVGQHAVSVSYNQDVMVFDNGDPSLFQEPPGVSRDYAAPRRYQLDLQNNVATEVWNYEMGQSIYNPICGSIYEDAPNNYLIDYADVGGPMADTQQAQILGLDPNGNKVFYYGYPTTGCGTIFNAIQIHLEDTSFPTVEPRPLNLSTRGFVGPGDQALIGGFIISGTDPKTVALRALGPSLGDFGLPDPLSDPALTLYDSSGAVVATNDDWQSSPSAAQISADGLAPSNPAEAAMIQTLQPGAYTFIVTGKDSNPPGIGLVEAYDLSPLVNSALANISTRGFVGTGDDVLISGFIIGDVAADTVILRALGNSLANDGVPTPLLDPLLTVYDANGSSIATNDNWKDDISVPDIEKNGLAPADDSESATLLSLPAGSYSAIVTGANGDTGISLVEVYNLN
jgi:hypothetical protein